MLNEIKGTILKDARKEGESALHKAEHEFEAEFSKVKGDGEAKIKGAELEAKKVVDTERRERMSGAKLEAKRILAEAKEDAVNAALDSLIDELKSYSGTKAYADKMKSLVSAAVEEVGGKATVYVKKGEKKIFSSIAGADIREGADIIGGAIVESKDGRLKIDLSMEEMLNSRKDSVRKELYGIMFK